MYLSFDEYQYVPEARPLKANDNWALVVSLWIFEKAQSKFPPFGLSEFGLNWVMADNWSSHLHQKGKSF